MEDSPRPVRHAGHATARVAECVLSQSQDVPKCTFALPIHVSFAAPASASHFSIATLQSASFAVAQASLES
jgi:hypothetical protein